MLILMKVGLQERKTEWCQLSQKTEKAVAGERKGKHSSGARQVVEKVVRNRQGFL